MKLGAIRYYLRSIPVLLRGVRNPLRTIALLASRPAKPQEIQLFDGTRFLVRSLLDLWIIKETCLDRDYERMGCSVEDDWTLVDVGAGLGDFTVSVARRFPNARIFAFEPFAESFDLMQRNLALNEIGIDRVHIMQEAVNSTGKPMVLSMLGESVQHSTSNTPMGARTKTVSARNLESLIEAHSIDVIDLLKVDCEGGEYDIFLTARPQLFERIRHVRMEYHDAHTQHRHVELIKALEAQGFAVSRFPNPVHAETGLIYASNLRFEEALRLRNS